MNFDYVIGILEQEANIQVKIFNSDYGSIDNENHRIELRATINILQSQPVEVSK